MDEETSFVDLLDWRHCLLWSITSSNCGWTRGSSYRSTNVRFLTRLLILGFGRISSRASPILLFWPTFVSVLKEGEDRSELCLGCGHRLDLGIHSKNGLSDVGIESRRSERLCQLDLVVLPSELLQSQQYDDIQYTAQRHLLSVRKIRLTAGSSLLFASYRDFRDPTEPSFSQTLTYWNVTAARLAFIIVFEHVIFFAVYLMQWLVPDVPRTIQNKIDHERYIDQRERWASKTTADHLKTAVISSEAISKMIKRVNGNHSTATKTRDSVADRAGHRDASTAIPWSPRTLHLFFIPSIHQFVS